MVLAKKDELELAARCFIAYLTTGKPKLSWRTPPANKDVEEISGMTFTDFPPEIRNRIYRFYLDDFVNQHDNAEHLPILGGRTAAQIDCKYTHSALLKRLYTADGFVVGLQVPSLTSTCRQIRVECLSLLYGEHQANFIWLRCRNDASSFRLNRWIDVLGDKVRWLKHLQIHNYVCDGCVLSPPVSLTHKVVIPRDCPQSVLDTVDVLPLIKLERLAPQLALSFRQWMLRSEALYGSRTGWYDRETHKTHATRGPPYEGDLKARLNGVHDMLARVPAWKARVDTDQFARLAVDYSGDIREVTVAQAVAKDLREADKKALFKDLRFRYRFRLSMGKTSYTVGGYGSHWLAHEEDPAKQRSGLKDSIIIE